MKLIFQSTMCRLIPATPRTVVFFTACLSVIMTSLAPVPVSAQKNAQDYIHYRLGIKYQKENNYKQAIEEFRKVLAAYPDNYNAYMHLAQIRKEQNMAKLAIYNLEKALSYNPRWSKAYKMLAQVYEKDGRIQKAIMQLQSYQQVCDPAVADSVQDKIDSLIRRISGEEGTQTRRDDTSTARASSEQEKTADDGSAASVDAPTDSKSSVSGQRRAHRVAETEPDAFKQAVTAYKNGNYEQALQHIHTCLKANPGHAGAYYYAGLIRRRWNQNKMARVNFEKSLSYPQLGYNAHFYLGKIYGEEKEYQKAISHLEEYIRKTDYIAGRQEAKKLIRRYHAHTRRPDTGITEIDIENIGKQALQREVEKIPHPREYNSIEVRIDSLLTLSLLDTFTAAGHDMLEGIRLYKKGLYEKAIEVFKKLQIDYSHDDVAATCIYNIGICNLKLGLYDNAASRFQHLLNRFPSHRLKDKASFFKAYAYLQKGDNELAQKLFREFIRVNSSHDWKGKAYEKLGDAYSRLSSNDKAIDAYEKAFSHAKSPRDKVYAAYNLGSEYAKIDNSQRMVKYLEKAIEAGTSHGLYERVPDSYYTLADYHYRAGKHDKALDYYKTVTRQYPNFHETPWALFQMANIYKHKENYEKALETYKLLQDKYPEDYWAKEAKWKIKDTIWENEYQAILQGE